MVVRAWLGPTPLGRLISLTTRLYDTTTVYVTFAFWTSLLGLQEEDLSIAVITPMF
jgi:hypothetical protein